MTDDSKQCVATLFSLISEDYDQGEVEFFSKFATAQVEFAELRTGERVRTFRKRLPRPNGMVTFVRRTVTAHRSGGAWQSRPRTLGSNSDFALQRPSPRPVRWSPVGLGPHLSAW